MSTPSVGRTIAPVANWHSGVRPPDNSELRRIVQDVLAGIRYAVCLQAVDPGQPGREQKLDRVISAAIRSMPAERQRHYRDTASAILAAGPAVRHGLFGRYASLDAESARRLGVRGMREKAGPVRVDLRLLGLRADGRGGVRGGARLDELAATWGVVAADFDPTLVAPELGGVVRYAGGPPGGDPAVPFPGYHKTLEFRVREIKCVDETNPESFGTDEIAIGGVAVDPLGNMVKIGAKHYDNFDDGDSEWFNPPWKFAVFTRPKPTVGVPAVFDSFGVLVALAERDGSGFSQFLTELWAEVKDEVTAAIYLAVLAGAAPATGFAAPVIAAAAAWAVSELVDWILGWFGDDIFPPKTATLLSPRGFAIMPPPNGVTDQGGVHSTPQSLHYYGFGGHYEVRYDWRLTDWVAGTG